MFSVLMALTMLSMTSSNWVKKAYIGIDQGAYFVVMIENHRTGLLWNSVMVDADVRAGLSKLGFQTTSVFQVPFRPDDIKVYS